MLENHHVQAAHKNFSENTDGDGEAKTGNTCNALSGRNNNLKKNNNSVASQRCFVMSQSVCHHSNFSSLLFSGALSGVSNIFSFWGENRGGGQYQEVPSCSLASPPSLSTPLHSLSRQQRSQLDTRLDLLQKQLNRYSH